MRRRNLRLGTLDYAYWGYPFCELTVSRVLGLDVVYWGSPYVALQGAMYSIFGGNIIRRNR